jgi:hypothetical protein
MNLAAGSLPAGPRAGSVRVCAEVKCRGDHRESLAGRIVGAGADRAHRPGTFGTLKEAKAEYARITNRRQEGTLVPPNKVTENELDRWLAMKAQDLEETTIYNYQITLDRVRGMLGNIRLQ